MKNNLTKKYSRKTSSIFLKIVTTFFILSVFSTLAAAGSSAQSSKNLHKNHNLFAKVVESKSTASMLNENNEAQNTPSKKEVLAHLKNIKIPVLSEKGKFNDEQARSLCIARLLSNQKAHRGKLTKVERVFLINITELTPPKWGSDGLNVSITCQGSFWIENNKITRVMTVSTGRKGYETRVGKYVVTRQWDNWHNSTLYGVPLYKTSYFSGGQAVHGLVSDSLVKPYPASAGCVRMTKKDAKWVYDRVKNRNITIKGKWQE